MKYMCASVIVFGISAFGFGMMLGSGMTRSQCEERIAEIEKSTVDAKDTCNKTALNECRNSCLSIDSMMFPNDTQVKVTCLELCYNIFKD